MPTPQEIANAATFLASPVSSFTTDSNLIVDGAISNRVNFLGRVMARQKREARLR
jgi:3-oxoacyl-[acyl-carrier protein] reductase